MPTASSSVSSNHKRKSFVRARRGNRMNSARWSRCKKAKARSSSTSRFMTNGRLTVMCSSPRLKSMSSFTGRTPDLVAGDAGFYSAKNVAMAKQMGVKRVSVPSRSTKSAALKREQKKRWFKNGQKWRTGCEGRISVLKRRHGLNRCRYQGVSGMKRWTGLGVIADNLINIGKAIDKQKKSAT